MYYYENLFSLKIRPFADLYTPSLLQALNNLQSTHAGFGHVNSENVFKVMITLVYHMIPV